MLDLLKPQNPQEVLQGRKLTKRKRPSDVAHSENMKDRIPIRVMRNLKQYLIVPFERDGQLFFKALVEKEHRYWDKRKYLDGINTNFLYCPFTNELMPFINNKGVNYISLQRTDAGKHRFSVIEEVEVTRYAVGYLTKVKKIAYPPQEIDYALLRKYY